MCRQAAFKPTLLCKSLTVFKSPCAMDVKRQEALDSIWKTWPVTTNKSWQVGVSKRLGYSNMLRSYARISNECFPKKSSIPSPIQTNTALVSSLNLKFGTLEFSMVRISAAPPFGWCCFMVNFQLFVVHHDGKSTYCFWMFLNVFQIRIPFKHKCSLPWKSHQTSLYIVIVDKWPIFHGVFMVERCWNMLKHHPPTNLSWLVVGPPLWKIWKSIVKMKFPIFLGK